MRSRAADSGVRLAELMAALSIATDLGMGQPLETALSTCVVAMRLGEALNLDDDTLRDVYYQALLRYIGCNSDADVRASGPWHRNITSGWTAPAITAPCRGRRSRSPSAFWPPPTHIKP
jgi:hypothetical protein